jgi:hypothetical protein
VAKDKGTRLIEGGNLRKTYRCAICRYAMRQPADLARVATVYLAMCAGCTGRVDANGVLAIQPRAECAC